MKKLLLIIISFLALSCQSQNYQSLTAKTFKEKLSVEVKPQILDVRSKEEFVTGHIENAISINWNDENFNDKVKTFDKTKAIFVNCQGGGRSKKAAERLFSLGFKTIYELNGGINEWKDESYPTKI